MKAEEMRCDKQQASIPESNNLDMRAMMRKTTTYRSSFCEIVFLPETDFHPHTCIYIFTYIDTGEGGDSIVKRIMALDREIVINPSIISSSKNQRKKGLLLLLLLLLNIAFAFFGR